MPNTGHTCGVFEFTVGSGHVGVIPRPSSSRAGGWCAVSSPPVESGCAPLYWRLGEGGTGTAKITEVQHRRANGGDNEKQHRQVNDEHEMQRKIVRDKSREMIPTKHTHSAASQGKYTEMILPNSQWSMICIRTGQYNCTPHDSTN